MARKKKNPALELPAIVVQATVDYLGPSVMNKLDAKASATIFEMAGRFSRDVALIVEGPKPAIGGGGGGISPL